MVSTIYAQIHISSIHFFKYFVQRSPPAQGFFSQFHRNPFTSLNSAFLSALFYASDRLLSLLDSSSAKLAISVDILSTCSMNTLAPRYPAKYLTHFKTSEAVSSLFTYPALHPHITAELSTLNTSCLFWILSGNIRKGSRTPMLSRVVD